MILVRKATAQEAPQIAPLLFLAMDEIFFSFIGERSEEKAIGFLSDMIGKTSNQYSFEHCWVAEENEKIIGAACVYEGSQLHQLRQPIADELKVRFGKEFAPEDETQAGEFYIDCVGVSSDQQGKGIGSKIFSFLIDEYVNKQGKTLGLLVDEDNPAAKKLYLKLGFQPVRKMKFQGKKMEHLQTPKQN